MILGFDIQLPYNFIHLMYANDLILITKATKKIAITVKTYLSIYSNLSDAISATMK